MVFKDHYYIPTDFIIFIIRLSNIKLQEIEFVWPRKQEGGPSLLLENISYYCSNLTKLETTIGIEEFPTLLVLLKNCRELKILEIHGNGEELDADDILSGLGLPLSHNLVELIIRTNWRFRHDSLLRFFENLVHIPLYKFVFKICDFINNDHLKVVLKHSMDSLKYITFKDEIFAKTDVGIGNASIWLKNTYMI